MLDSRGLRATCDEECARVGVRTAVRHGHHTVAVVPYVEVLVGEHSTCRRAKQQRETRHDKQAQLCVNILQVVQSRDIPFKTFTSMILC